MWRSHSTGRTSWCKFINHFTAEIQGIISLHTLCVRHSVMQDLALVKRFCAQNPKNTIFLGSPERPLPPVLELLMEDLVTSGLRLPGIELMEDLVTLGLRLPRIPLPPGIGTCHGGLSNFGPLPPNENFWT